MKLFNVLPKLALALAVFSAMTTSAWATALNTSLGGELNGGALSVAVSAACINFYDTMNPDACPNTNTFLVGAPSDANLFTLGAMATILDLNGTPSLVDFVTIGSGASEIFFDMTSMIVPNPVTCPPAGPTPASCSAGDFVFTQTDATDVTVSFSLNAIGYTGMSSTGSTPYNFSFSSQFANSTISGILNTYINNPPVVDSVSLTASPVSGAPEPAAFLLLGGGLLGIGIFGKRARR